jgi:chromosome segregation ATPase
MSVEKLQREISKWEGRLSELQQKAEQAMARANALEQERRALALAAAEGDEKAEKAMNRKAAEADEARRQSDNFGLMGRQAEGKLATLREELADAQRQELLATLRQALAQHTGIVRRFAQCTQRELLPFVAELMQSADAIGDLGAQFGILDRQGARRVLFRAPLGFLAWSVDRELALLGERYEAFEKMNFAPINNDFERPLEEHQEHVCADLAKTAERHIEGISLARERARGLIRVEEGEQLYRIRLGMVGVRGVTLQPGEVIALRPEEAAGLGDVIELVEDTPAQEQVA